MENVEEIELTKAQRLAGNLTAGGFIIACGLFLLLAGVGVIPLNVKDIIVPSILAAMGLFLLVVALIQHNSVSLWISFVFLVPSLVSFLAVYSPMGYSKLYPLYIAIPAIASLFTMILSSSKLSHLKCIAFFGVIAIIFALRSSGLLSWSIVLPILVVFVGLLIIYFALKVSRNDEEEL